MQLFWQKPGVRKGHEGITSYIDKNKEVLLWFFVLEKKGKMDEGISAAMFFSGESKGCPGVFRRSGFGISAVGRAAGRGTNSALFY